MLGIMLCIGQATRQKSYMYVTPCSCLTTCRTCSVGHARWWNGSNTLKQHPAVSLIIITPTPPIFNTHVYLCDAYNFTSSTSIWVEQSPPHSSPAIPHLEDHPTSEPIQKTHNLIDPEELATSPGIETFETIEEPTCPGLSVDLRGSLKARPPRRPPSQVSCGRCAEGGRKRWNGEKNGGVVGHTRFLSTI